MIYNKLKTSQIYVTSEQGDKLAIKPNIEFKLKKEKGAHIVIYPDKYRQKIDGIGSSITESSAFVLAHLDIDNRQQVMQNIFSEKGADFSITRIPIGATDFCVKGQYSYVDKIKDTQLDSFSIDCDKDGFSRSEYEGIKDESFDILPMLKEAIAIKNEQHDKNLKIVSSAWTAPSWMKDIEKWYIPGTPDNNYQGTGGSLKPGYEKIYTNYLIKYLEAYQKEGVNVWAMTPVNEPLGNNGQWESMHFSAESQRDFIKSSLGPALQNFKQGKTKLLFFDHNRDLLEQWTNTLMGDKECVPYLYGAAVHWYESTYKVSEDVFDKVHDKFPQCAIIHTEGCIDDLGKDAPNGILDPKRYKEKNWFNNDEFWWNDNATDWAYTATWQGVIIEDHPIYTPVHRYARNIIVSLNHWLNAWIDWNIVLDHKGGPNHVGNFCGAPIMIDTQSQDVYYTPVFYILAQLSKTIRPGDVVVSSQIEGTLKANETLYSCSTLGKDGVLSIQILNTEKKKVSLAIQIGKMSATIEVDNNCLMTLQIPLWSSA